MKLLITLALSTLLVAGAPGAQILVPGDHPTLAAAVSAAWPGATIVVSTPQLQSPVVVDRPLTIIGDPVVNVGTDDLCHGPQQAAILLAGPGSGTVVLSQVNLVQCFDAPQMAELLGGGGFSELHVYDSTIVSSLTGLSGSGSGSPAISISVPFFMLSGSTVIGGRDDIDICLLGGFPAFMPPFLAYPGIEASGSTVVVLDSSVRGGSHNSQCCKFCVCPGDLSTVAGPGGAGIVAAEVLMADSSVQGGSGAKIYAGTEPCGTTPDGPDVVTASVAALPGILAGSGPMQLGSTWTLNYFAPGPAAVLLFSFGVSAPIDLPGFGWFFLGPGTLLLGPLTTGVPDSVSFPIPSDTWLLGLELSFQVFDASIGFTRPVLGALVP